ncbi:hypothetical protein [Halopiger aswanensis]|nr:hypothetical protein [Halopiger aswanensis]
MTGDNELCDHDWVESAWKDRLQQAGIDESTARWISAHLQSTPALTTGSVSRRTARTAIQAAIDRVALAQYGVDDPEAVRRDLRRALDAGLNGALDGPVAIRAPSAERRYHPRTCHGAAQIDAGVDCPDCDDCDGVSGKVRVRSTGNAAGEVDAAAIEADEVIAGSNGELPVEGSGMRSAVVDAIQRNLETTLDSERITRPDLVAAVSVLTGTFDGSDVDPPISNLVAEFQQLVDRGVRPSELVEAIERLD